MLGVVYAQMLFVVTPETMFGIGVSVQALIVNLVGGIGHPVGPLLGTLIMCRSRKRWRPNSGRSRARPSWSMAWCWSSWCCSIPRGLIDELRRFDLSGRPGSQDCKHGFPPPPEC